MRIHEKCSCGSSVFAEDAVSKGPGTSEDVGQHRYSDGTGTGYAADFVEKWRDQHVCKIEEALPGDKSV